MTSNLLLRGGPGHDFDATSEAVQAVLGEIGIETTTVDDPDAVVARLGAAVAGDAAPVDLLTVDALRWGMDQDRYDDLPGGALRDLHAYRLSDEGAEVLERFVHSGGGLLALHTAVICFDAHPRWRSLCGAAWRWEQSSHPPVGSAQVQVTPSGRRHPVTEGIDDFTLVDEVYGFLDEVDGLDPLLTSRHGGREHPVLWAREVGAGRVVTDLLGHDATSIEHPAHRQILQQAATWAHRVPLGTAAPTRVAREVGP